MRPSFQLWNTSLTIVQDVIIMQTVNDSVKTSSGWKKEEEENAKLLLSFIISLHLPKTQRQRDRERIVLLNPDFPASLSSSQLIMWLFQRSLLVCALVFLFLLISQLSRYSTDFLFLWMCSPSLWMWPSGRQTFSLAWNLTNSILRNVKWGLCDSALNSLFHSLSLCWSGYWLTDELTSRSVWRNLVSSPLQSISNTRRVDLRKPQIQLVSTRSCDLCVHMCLSMRVYVCVCVFAFACMLWKPHDSEDVNCWLVGRETSHEESPEKRQEELAFKISWLWQVLALIPLYYLWSLQLSADIWNLFFF